MDETTLTVRDKDGDVFSGTPTQIVHRMHITSLAQASDDAAFMTEMAKRALEMTGQFVRDTGPADFIGDLISCALLERLDRVPNFAGKNEKPEDET